MISTRTSRIIGSRTTVTSTRDHEEVEEVRDVATEEGF
jgi:hypothetical protein